MEYFKSSQPVPGKGFAWTFYECDDDRTVRRYLTFFPETGEVKKVADPIVKELYDSNSLMPASEDEFKTHWPQSAEDDGGSTTAKVATTSGAQTDGGIRYFSLDMAISEAMSVHPRVGEVFAAFHLGGCASCGISQIETIGQVCMAYGVDSDTLLEVLEGLMELPVEAE